MTDPALKVSDINVFDRERVRQNRNRSTGFSDEHNFLFDWAISQMEERLSVITKKFPLAVQIGARGKELTRGTSGIEHLVRIDLANGLNPDVIADEEFLPFAQSSLDMVISPLSLHSTNDLPGALLQIRQALKPDGLLMAAMLGGETLHELRSAMMAAEIETKGGVSPRVSPFADMQQMGSLMQRAGFSLPVIDSEIVTVTYDNMFKLMQDLRAMGEGNALSERARSFNNRKTLLRAAELYQQQFSEPDGRIRATFEVIFLSGWAPDASQQQPLRPGSAKHSLAERLQTEEITTGEKTAP